MRPSQQVLDAWGLDARRIEPIDVGNINLTYRVFRGDLVGILQRLNPIFKPEVHHDIEAVTGRLESRGLPTPRLIRTRGNHLWEEADGGCWRLQTHMEGANHSTPTGPEMIRSAGALMARFQGALRDLDHTFRARRLGVHDTLGHLQTLRQALAEHGDHRAFGDAQALASEITSSLAELPALAGLPERIVHGDPKLNNFMFDDGGNALCLIDLDTVGPMASVLELGDALRSWCNPAGEDQGQVSFDRELFEAALTGYRSGGELDPTDRLGELAAASVETITLELAARFAADILNESYFGWDAERFDAAFEHHRLRARGQLALARSIGEQRRELETIARKTLG